MRELRDSWLSDDGILKMGKDHHSPRSSDKSVGFGTSGQQRIRTSKSSVCRRQIPWPYNRDGVEHAQEILATGKQ